MIRRLTQISELLTRQEHKYTIIIIIRRQEAFVNRRKKTSRGTIISH